MLWSGAIYEDLKQLHNVDNPTTKTHVASSIQFFHTKMIASIQWGGYKEKVDKCWQNGAWVTAITVPSSKQNSKAGHAP